MNAVLALSRKGITTGEKRRRWTELTYANRPAEKKNGGVLENLVKRIDRKAVRACVQDRASFDAALESLASDAS